MKLNDTAYVHVKIRKLCLQLELISGMKLLTDLDEEIYEIRFVNQYGYLIIDYKRGACFTLSHKMDKQEWEIAHEIIVLLDWLDIGNSFSEQRKRRNRYEKK